MILTLKNECESEALVPGLNFCVVQGGSEPAVCADTAEPTQALPQAGQQDYRFAASCASAHG